MKKNQHQLSEARSCDLTAAGWTREAERDYRDAKAWRRPDGVMFLVTPGGSLIRDSAVRRGKEFPLRMLTVVILAGLLAVLLVSQFR